MMNLNSQQLPKRRTLVLLALFTIGLGASTTAPALAQSSGTWTLTGSMKGVREGQTATLLSNGQVLVAGGYNGKSDVATADLYDPSSGRWSSTGSMSTARAGHTATLLANGQVLVAGGFSDSFTYLSSAELYNPATGVWTLTGSMSVPRTAHTATLLPSGLVLVAGGDSYSPVTNTFTYYSTAELYHPSTGTWTATGSMSTFRYLHTATLLQNGQVLAAGGFGPVDFGLQGSVPSAELYNPSTGKWKLTGSMNQSRAYHAAVLLANGQVLVVKGDQFNGPSGNLTLTSCELYDPSTGKWTLDGNTISVAADGFSVTLLNTGKVLIAGGIVPRYPGTSVILDTAELFDPSTGTSASSGNMNVARSGHSATLLQNGQVLAAGGESKDQKGNFIYVNSAEVYTP